MSIGDRPTTLKRSLGLTLTTFYGLGTIIGGGIYALLGKVAGQAGMLAPVAFLTASLIALVSACSFAELSARFPFSGGEAYYVQQAFRRSWLSTITGWLVIATGVVSAATLSKALAGFVQYFFEMPAWPIVLAGVLVLGALAAWGITETALVALAITVIEAGGLLFFLIAAGDHLGELPERWREVVPNFAAAQWSGVFLGAHLAFYSFVGFEDMVNIAEEVKDARRNLPRAILIALVISALLYFAVSLVAVLAAPRAELAATDSPLSLVLGDSAAASTAITLIGLLAGFNGALVQVVMASRVAYGLATKGQAPAWLANVHPRTRTPLAATALATMIVLALALWFPLQMLAAVTSSILLAVFALVNLALWHIKKDTPSPPEEGPNFPRWLPLAGTAICSGLLVFHVVMKIRG